MLPIVTVIDYCHRVVFINCISGEPVLSLKVFFPSAICISWNCQKILVLQNLKFLKLSKKFSTAKSKVSNKKAGEN